MASERCTSIQTDGSAISADRVLHYIIQTIAQRLFLCRFIRLWPQTIVLSQKQYE